MNRVWSNTSVNIMSKTSLYNKNSYANWLAWLATADRLIAHHLTGWTGASRQWAGMNLVNADSFCLSASWSVVHCDPKITWALLSCASCRCFATTTCPARLQFQSFILMCCEIPFLRCFRWEHRHQFLRILKYQKIIQYPNLENPKFQFISYYFETRCHTYCIFKLPTNIKQLIKIRTAVSFEAKSTELQMTVLLSLHHISGETILA